jgi:hypothetical protein
MIKDKIANQPNSMYEFCIYLYKNSLTDNITFWLYINLKVCFTLVPGSTPQQDNEQEQSHLHCIHVSTLL